MNPWYYLELPEPPWLLPMPPPDPPELVPIRELLCIVPPLELLPFELFELLELLEPPLDLLLATPRAFRVFWLGSPVTLRPLDFWKSLIASAVSSPHLPSIFPGSKPFCFSAC